MESIHNTPLIVENVDDRRQRLSHSWRLPVILVFLPVVIQVAAALFPSAVERFYSQGVYLHLARAIGFVTGIAPFSVAELGMIGLLASISVLTIFYVCLFL